MLFIACIVFLPFDIFHDIALVGRSIKFDNNVTITAAKAECHSQNEVNKDDVRCIIKNHVRGMGNKISFSEYTIAMLSTLITELNKDFLSNYLFTMSAIVKRTLKLFNCKLNSRSYILLVLPTFMSSPDKGTRKTMTKYFLIQSLDLNSHVCLSTVCYSNSIHGTHIYSLSCITYI